MLVTLTGDPVNGSLKLSTVAELEERPDAADAIEDPEEDVGDELGAELGAELAGPPRPTAPSPPDTLAPENPVALIDGPLKALG
jgi:hypothetical protein